MPRAAGDLDDAVRPQALAMIERCAPGSGHSLGEGAHTAQAARCTLNTADCVCLDTARGPELVRGVPVAQLALSP